MLKKTLLTLVVVAGLFAAVAIPGAAAHSSVSATAKAATKSNCPAGTAGAGNYCEHFCVVPRMYGDSILKAIVLLNLADCKLGQLTLNFNSSVSAPPLEPSSYGVFKVVRQYPIPGIVRRAHYPVSLWVKYMPH